MDRFSKKFGQKDGQNPGSRGSEAGQGHPARGEKEQVFGLQFIFDSGESVTVTSLPTSIGRGEKSDIVLKDDTVSDTHARVYYDERVRNVCIMDMDSLNGVFIADQPTLKNVLYDGAKIRLGKVNLTFRDTGYIHPG